MKERPILFSAPMVRAILDGSKTQTRRVVKKMALDWLAPDFFTPEYVALPENVLSPFGYAGDRLRVRETWQYADWTEDGMPYIRYKADGAVRFIDGGGGEDIADVWAELSEPANYAIDNTAADRRWRPSIFMPRWASRITLEVTDVRVERLQDISEDDAVAEGVWHDGRWYRGGTHPVKGSDQCWPTAVRAYVAVWDTMNAKRAPWDSNPWVWCVSFRRLEATP